MAADQRDWLLFHDVNLIWNHLDLIDFSYERGGRHIKMSGFYKDMSV